MCGPESRPRWPAGLTARPDKTKSAAGCVHDARPADVTFSAETGPLRVMDSAIAVVETPRDIEAVYRAEANRLWHAIYAFAGDAEVADDAVAEAYAQMLHRGEGVRDPAAWVWRAAFRICRGDLKTRRAPRPTLPPVEQVDQYANTDLLDALHQLPEAQRAAVILFYYADLPIRQIAERLGTNSLAVRANLSRGRRRLRTLLGDHDG